MKKLLYFTLVVIVVTSCDNEVEQKEIPDCIQHRINEIMTITPKEPRDKIGRYLYNDEIVFTGIKGPFSEDIMNSNCEIVCRFYIGGAAAPSTNCVNFDQAQFIEIVWEDKRK